MTREEAIDILNNAAWLGTNQQIERVEEAIQIVKALAELNDPDCVKVVRCKNCNRAFYDVLIVNGDIKSEAYFCKNTKAEVDPEGYCDKGREK